MESAKRKIKKAYLASPLGFSDAGRLYYYTKLIPALKDIGLDIIDPWGLSDLNEIERVSKMEFGAAKRDAWRKLNPVMGRNNAAGIDKADIIIAVLDGVDIDSGTASEIGYGNAKGKAIEGYRGDFRLSADNIGSTVNLQVEYFITSTGGEIADSLEKLLENIKRTYII